MPRLIRAVPVAAVSPAWLPAALESWGPEQDAELATDTVNLTSLVRSHRSSMARVPDMSPLVPSGAVIAYGRDEASTRGLTR